jgi:dTDP-4-amino-4,6-dideoxygalactose transaminase
MHNRWPLGDISKHLQRPELSQLLDKGYEFNDPWDVIDIFEKKVAAFAGSRFGIAVDCCSHGLFLCMKYLKATGDITLPKKTYVSVPMQVIHAGCNVKFEDIKWFDQYQLKPYPIWDAATMWQRGMYQSGYQVISFQIKKYIPIGRGGMILTDDAQAYRWLKKACHDGRDMEKVYLHDEFELVVWHYYMTPEDAARGILLMDYKNSDCPKSWSDQSYHDISTKYIFNNSRNCPFNNFILFLFSF